MSLIYGALKALAMLVGFVLGMISLMAIMGIFTTNVLVQAGVAVVVMCVVPLVLANFMLPDPEDEAANQKSKGIVTDVYAMVWMILGVFFVGIGGSNVTKPALENEAKVLAGLNPAIGEALIWSIGHDGKEKEEDKDVAKKVDDKAAKVAVKKEDKKGEDKAKEDAKKGPLVKMNPAQIFKKCSPSVVAIKIEMSNGRKGGGTGFFVNKDTIATNHHVVGKASKIKIKFVDGTVAAKNIWILDEDSKKDLALVKIDVPESQKFELCPFANSDKIEIGSNVITIGNPLGLEHTLSNGIISQRRMLRGRKMIQFTAPISPGNSGGPLIDEYGRILGVNTLKVTGGMFGHGENLNLAVPINELKALIKDDYPNKRRVGEAAPNERTTW